MSLKKMKNFKQYSNPQKETAIAEMQKDNTKSVLVRMPESLHTKLKIKCAEEKTSITSVILSYLDSYISR